MMLPPSLEELVDANHLVRLVNQVIDRINIDPLLKKFKGGGTSSYHLGMLLKVLVYGYLSNIYSSRRLEASLKEPILGLVVASANGVSPAGTCGASAARERLQGIAYKRRFWYASCAET